MRQQLVSEAVVPWPGTLVLPEYSTLPKLFYCVDDVQDCRGCAVLVRDTINTVGSEGQITI